MRDLIERAKQLDIQFDYETGVRMACLCDVGEALLVECARLEEIGLPTHVHDELLTKIEHEFRALAAKYNPAHKGQAVT
ncbi:MAG: hypothetical protein WCD69_07000 [Xanthobacteraceae bacterium]